MLGQPLHGHEPPPGRDAQELGGHVAEQHLPHRRMHAIGAHQRSRCRHHPIVETHADAVGGLLEADELVAKANGAGPRLLDRVHEDPVQIAAMGHPVRGAVFFNGGLAEIEELPGLAGVIEPHLLALGYAGDVFDRLAQSQRDENARAIGAELQPRAEFPQLRRLLVDVHRKALLDEGQRRHEPADSSSNNSDRRVFGHENAISAKGSSVSGWGKGQTGGLASSPLRALHSMTVVMQRASSSGWPR